MYLLGLLPFLWLAASAALFLSQAENAKFICFRSALVRAALLASLWCVLGTELLSCIKQLRFLPLLFWWGLPLLAMSALLWVRRKRIRWASIRFDSRYDWILFVGLVAVLVIVGFIALSTPPNNVDSDQYHLPRQVVWMQQGHVGHFGANDQRQLSMPPFAEFAGVHLMILSGDDHWANGVQWLALVLVAVVISLITKLLDGGTRAQLLASIFAVTYPTAALQSLNTKNDVVTGLFVCIAAFISARIAKEKCCSWERALMLGSAIGLAVLSKGTGMLFVLPFCVFAGVSILWIHRGRGVALGAAISMVVLLINVAHFARNYAECQSIFGLPPTRGGYPLRNETHTPGAILSNVSRNLAMHLTFTPAVHVMVSNAVVSLHDFIGMSVNDKRLTYYSGGDFAVSNPYPNSEGQSRGPLHVVIILLSAICVAVPLFKMTPWQRCFCLAVFVSFLVFCIEVKWQVWHNRLHIPFFFLVAPLAGIVFARHWIVGYCTGIALLVHALPLVVMNQSKPLLKEDSIFQRSSDEIRYHARPQCLSAAEWLTKVCVQLDPQVIALDVLPHCFIYPVQRTLLRLPNKPEFFLLKPTYGKRFSITNVVPDMVLSIDARPPKRGPIPNKVTHASGKVFHFVAEFANLRLYLPDETRKKFDVFPPFHGWTPIEGLTPLEGPYREAQLPVVRWGRFPETKVEFLSDGGESALTLVARAEDVSTNQTITIHLNGSPVQTNTVTAGRFEEIEAILRPNIGTNQLRIEYSIPQTNPRGNALLFKRLQIK